MLMLEIMAGWISMLLLHMDCLYCFFSGIIDPTFFDINSIGAATYMQTKFSLYLRTISFIELIYY